MNKIIALIFTMFLISCLNRSFNIQYSTSENFRIKNIDSINNYYIINASRNDSIFKVISKKEQIKNCSNRILKNKNYKLNLHSVFKDIKPIVLNNNLYQITSWAIDDSLSLPMDSINSYYTTDNIKGLCYVKNRK